MSSSKTALCEAKDQFWSVVRGCLREFHKMTSDMTRRKATQLRKKIESLPNEAMEFFYHSEPFDVACDIANEPLNLQEFLDRYLQVRDGQQANGTLAQVLWRPSK